MDFTKKKILLAPYSGITEELALFLKSRNYEGEATFIDKNKQGNNIHHPNNIQNLDFDYIFIYSNHANAIYQEYIKKGIPKKKIYFVSNINAEFKFHQNQILYNISLYLKKLKLDELRENLNFHIARILSKIYFLPINENVFVTTLHFDSNIKYLYLYLKKQGITSTILSSNASHINELKKYNFKCIDFTTVLGQLYFLKAKRIITAEGGKKIRKDRLKPSQDLIQLLHGVLIKNVPDQSSFNHFKYFFTTSNNVIKDLYKERFSAENYLNFGHPRNDALFNDIQTQEEELFCDMNIYNLIKDTNKKVIVYAPTFRTYGFYDFPIDFAKLNTFLENMNALFVIKLHNQIYEDLNHYIFEQAHKFENIVLHNKNNDIYPILNKTDILISDYSSIANDFILLNRPMLFLTYDKQRYIKTRGDFSVDFDEYTPGGQVTTQDELHKELSDLFNDIDTYKQHREKLLDYYYDFKDNQSCKRITDVIYT